MRLGISVEVDLPQRWRFQGGASTRGFDVRFYRRPAPRPQPTTQVCPASPPPPEPEKRLEGGGVIGQFEHAGYGFTAPRWTPLDEGDHPDP